MLVEVAVAVLASAVAAAALVKGAKYVAALALACAVATVLLRRRGNGLLLALVLTFTVPGWAALGAAQLSAGRVALVLACAGLVTGISRTRFRVIDAVVLGIAGVTIVSWATHTRSIVDYRLLIAAVVPMALYFVTRVSVSWDMVDRLLWVILLAATAGALSVLWEYFVAGHVVFASGDPTLSQFNGGAGRIFRPGGIFGGSPTAAISLAMGSLVTLPLVSTTRGLRRALVGGCLLLIISAIVLTFGRAGWLGFAGGLIVFLFLVPVRMQWWLAAGAVAALAAVTLLWGATPLSTRNSTVQLGIVRADTITVRQSTSSDALPLLADTGSHLLFGRGFDVFFAQGPVDYRLAQTQLPFQGGPLDDYLRVIIEEGLLGFILLVAWLAGAFSIAFFRVRRLPERTPERLVLAGFAGAIVCYAIGSVAHDTEHAVTLFTLAFTLSAALVTLSTEPPPGAAALD